MSELLYCVWFSTLKNLRYNNFKKLYNKMGNFSAIYNSNISDLDNAAKLSDGEKANIKLKDTNEAEKIISDCEKTGIDIVSFFDERYPEMLKNISNPPKLLYTKGSLKNLNGLATVTVVGSRRPSVYGNKMCFKIGYELAREGVTVVSGMARGIDSQTQRGVLKAGGKTIAVLGTGCDIVYPPENKELMSIIENNGCVISEYPPGTAAYASNFPKRNRIMSGISLGVVIAEGEASSGTMITARLALEQGREVFCLPGNVDSPLSFVPNKLIREGAPLITSAQDIIIELSSVYPELMLKKVLADEKNEMETTSVSELSEEQKKIVCSLDKNTPKHIDEICFLCNLDIASVNQNLLMLEIKNVVASMPGKYYLLK